LARDNYSYRKYQRELTKKKKKEEKLQRKLDKKNQKLQEGTGQASNGDVPVNPGPENT
jgi:hypothetical protein